MSNLYNVNLTKESDYDNYQPPLRPPNENSVDLHKDTDYNNKNDDHDKTPDPPPPHEYIISRPIPISQPPQNQFKKFNIESNQKKSHKKKKCMSKSNASLLILILGFLCPFIWLISIKYLRRYGKASRYAIASICLFTIYFSIAVVLIPIIILYKRGAFEPCDTCIYEGGSSDGLDFD